MDENMRYIIYIYQGRRQRYGQYGHGHAGFRAVRRSLGCLRDLRTFSNFQASKVATREFRFLSFRDIYSNTCARGKRANWGGANMRVVHSSHFWQLGSIASPATKTTGGGDSSSILSQTWPQNPSQSA